MSAEPDFCRDILETRIKGILKEHLKISRDITFLQVCGVFYLVDLAPGIGYNSPAAIYNI